jgi:hypothetical protein
MEVNILETSGKLAIFMPNSFELRVFRTSARLFISCWVAGAMIAVAGARQVIDPVGVSAEKMIGFWASAGERHMDMERFIGGSPLAVFVRLVIISIVTGIALSAAGYDPRDLLANIPRLIQAVYDFGFGWVRTVIEYFLLGAVIVIPVWLVLRFVKFVAGDAGKGDINKRP